MAKDHSATVTIRNRLGLHARAANLFVRTANQFKAEITVGKGLQKVNGKSILGILTLAAGYNSKITIEAEGEEAEEAVEALAHLVRDRFEEGDG
ncbi:HPr family phosphocarrier protein [Nitrospinae bacterium AH_259_B05_G02_I21]|nr:HPr family phosphocarrier protein [Nitrospinae bacterium AH_259_B05_G02_I21]MDA2931610.1 HPr family phosphocarrier protein [Nitrospinae bacterium AH-259-F20]